MITYTTTLTGVIAGQLRGGFFEGWPNPPTPETLLRILHGSAHVVLAQEGAQVVGVITALSDGVLTAYIPMLEVLPTYRNQGIGGALVRRMVAELGPIYAIDLLCDDSLVPYYQRLGFITVRGMALRDYAMQSGLPDTGAVSPS
ncbi:MAG: GNAT family N-acetyltransferase [Anaerolineae bacterium]|nr:GNAT family N-acetyltransferase [Anaerolineae bacterium]